MFSPDKTKTKGEKTIKVLSQIWIGIKIAFLIYVLIVSIALLRNFRVVIYSIFNSEDIEWLMEEKKQIWNNSKEQNINNDNGQEKNSAELPQDLRELIKDTPMVAMESAIVNNQYKVSPYLLVGIAKAESNYGRDFYHWKDFRNYNYWGIKPPKGKREDGSYLKWYNSPEEAVNDCARLLREEYIDKGYTTVEAIMTKYVGPDSQNWVNTVQGIVGDNQLAMK